MLVSFLIVIPESCRVSTEIMTFGFHSTYLQMLLLFVQG